MIEIVLKVTGLLLLGGAVALLLRWHSAAARHFVWVLALSSTLLLPIVGPFAPLVEVTMTSPAPKIAPEPLPIVVPIERAPIDAVSIAVGLPEPEPARGPSFASVLAALWILGSVLLLARVLMGHLGLYRVAKRATPIGPEWEPLIGSAIEASGVRRTLRFAYSSAVGGPLAWGLFRPIILFPTEAKNWPRDRMRVALLHELAHVARYDHASQLVSQIACAIYWFHPLVWLAARALRAESEHACDDRVIEAGMPGHEYAELLLDVARSVKAPRFNASFATSMARHSHLEDRLRAVLDDERTRSSLPPGARAFFVFLAVLLLLPIAGLTAKHVLKDDAPVPAPAPAPSIAVEVHSDDDVDSDGDFVREIDVDPGETLRVDLSAGGDLEISGWDQARVRVEVDGLHRRSARALEVERDASGVRISLRDGPRAGKIRVKVPRRFNASIHSGAGGISISGVEGTFKGNTGGGAITLSELRGRADLNTGGGKILVADSTLDGFVNTGGGSVRVVRVQGALRANSGGGPVTYEQSDSDPIRLESAGGDIRMKEALRGGRISTGGGNIHVGRSGPIDAQTGGGNIELGPVTGSVRAKTGAGNVTVLVAGDGGETQTIDLSSGSGNVKLALPEDFEGSFDLSTSTSFGGGKITSAFALSIENSKDGVRAKGKIGRAPNVVRIRTHDGNITIEKR